MEKLLNVREAAVFMGISPHTVRMWVYAGKLTHIRLSRRVLFSKEDLQAHIDKSRINACRK